MQLTPLLTLAFAALAAARPMDADSMKDMSATKGAMTDSQNQPAMPKGDKSSRMGQMLAMLTHNHEDASKVEPNMKTPRACSSQECRDKNTMAHPVSCRGEECRDSHMDGQMMHGHSKMSADMDTMAHSVSCRGEECRDSHMDSQMMHGHTKMSTDKTMDTDMNMDMDMDMNSMRASDRMASHRSGSEMMADDNTMNHRMTGTADHMARSHMMNMDMHQDSHSDSTSENEHNDHHMKRSHIISDMAMHQDSSADSMHEHEHAQRDSMDRDTEMAPMSTAGLIPGMTSGRKYMLNGVPVEDVVSMDENGEVTRKHVVGRNQKQHCEWFCDCASFSDAMHVANCKADSRCKMSACH